MSRIGWGILGLFGLLFAAFLSVTSFGVSDGSPPSINREPGTVRTVETTVRRWIGRHGGGTLVVPVAGVARRALYDSWGDPRENGKRQHHGTDIPAPAGTPVIAAAAGTIEKLFRSTNGGTTLYVRSADGHWLYYYAHLAGYAPAAREGLKVRAGDPLGFVGDTGDAGAGNYHLHLGLSRMRPGDHWWQGEDVDPYPFLAAGRLPS